MWWKKTAFGLSFLFFDMLLVLFVFFHIFAYPNYLSYEENFVRYIRIYIYQCVFSDSGQREFFP